jgi:hypothetical protein
VIRITVEIVLSNSETEFVIDSLGSLTDQLIPSCVHKGSRWLPDEGDRGDREDGGEAGEITYHSFPPFPIFLMYYGKTAT